MVAIVQYNAGNILSVQNALNRLGVESTITGDPETIRRAAKVIFPGVGEAGTAMKHLRETGLDLLIPALTQPVLGVCLGLQLLCAHSAEGDTRCLGVFDTPVKRFEPLALVPHMGWNSFTATSGPLFSGIQTGDDVYYVHSYYADVCAHTVAVCNYINPFSTALQKDNFFATQFHPEKSAAVGEKILQNFLNLPA